MSEVEIKPERKRPRKMKKDKKQHSKKQKIEKTKGIDSKESTEDKLVFAGAETFPKKKTKVIKSTEMSEDKNSVSVVTGKIVKKKKKKKAKVPEGQDKSVLAGNTKISKKKREKKVKVVPENEETAEDNSVFAVTEKLLMKKKEKKEKKQTEGLHRKKAELEKKIDNDLQKIKAFFQDNSDSHDVNGKIKPHWFDGSIKKFVTLYQVSVENCNKELTSENKLIRKQNEKRLYRFFQKLSKHLGEEMAVLKHWFQGTKKGVLKAGLKLKADQSCLLKLSRLNKSLKAICKETSTIVKSDDSNPPVWVDEHFAKLVKIRNKAKREMQANPTEENQKAFKLAFKNVKTERRKKMKSVLIASKGPQSRNPRVTIVSNSDAKIVKSSNHFGAGNKVQSNKRFGSSTARPTKSPSSNVRSQSFASSNAKSQSFASSNVRSQSFASSNAKSQSFASSNAKSQSFGLSKFGTTPNKSNKHIKFDD